MEKLVKQVEPYNDTYFISVSNRTNKVTASISFEAFDFLIGDMKAGEFLSLVLISEINCRTLKGKGFINNKYYDSLSDEDKNYILFGDEPDVYQEYTSIYNAIIDIVQYGVSIIKSEIIKGDIFNYVLSLSIENDNVTFKYEPVRSGSLKDLNFC